MKKIMRIEDYVKENREVINDLRIASALLEKRRPIIAESLMDLAERLDDLAESEDERIMETLLKWLKSLTMSERILTYGETSIEDIISRLEKQKERKLILEVFGFKVGDAVRLKDGDGRKHIIKSFEEVEGLHGPNFYHVEFEDDSARDSIFPGKEYPNGYYTQMEKIDDAQKPTEWSKEDEEMYARIVRRYTDYEGVIMRTKEESVAAKMLDAMAQEEIWLKSLSSNLKKKNEDVAKLCSNEWSKEDEKMLNELITIMDGGKVTSGTYLSEYAHWLKSIRPQPHWKPSEEQMGALSWMLENARGNIDFDPLKELYEQLKKL